MKYFEDFALGEKRESPRRHLITEEEIMEFGNRWDYQPFHVDREAAKASVFGGLVASSTHLFAVSVSLFCHKDLDSAGRSAAISALGFNNMKLKAPARSGDELKCVSVVIEKRQSNSRPDAGILVMRNEVTNQREELVFIYEHAALYRLREAL
ncbi:MAG: acyl dehydratase [Halieaceae bacterium]|nr:acyl dehydratase [Halieaceae bacterium]